MTSCSTGLPFAAEDCGASCGTNLAVPAWIYTLHPVVIALLVQLLVVPPALVGLWLTRRFLTPRLRYHDGVNDAIGGAVQGIGVFYGVTVGLISVGVWNTYAMAEETVAQEASAIGSLYRDVRSFPQPASTHLREKLRAFTQEVVSGDWPVQIRDGKVSEGGSVLLDKFQIELNQFRPVGAAQEAIYAETLAAFNRTVSARRQRLNAVESGLSGTMWSVIWVGACLSIGVAYFFYLEDWRLHTLLIAFTSSFLALVIYMIVINDRPFFGRTRIGTSNYELLLQTLMTDLDRQPRQP